MLNRLLRAGLATAALALAPWLAATTMAACGVTAESVAKADVVFVGLLTDVSFDGTHATFQVQELWRGTGPRVGGVIAVDTTNSLQRLELPPAGTPPSRYLVLAQSADGRLHTGKSCDVFPFPWDESYAGYRPADAPSPAPGRESGTASGVPPAVAVVTATALVLVIVGFVAFRRGSAR